MMNKFICLVAFAVENRKSIREVVLFSFGFVLFSYRELFKFIIRNGYLLFCCKIIPVLSVEL